LRGQLVGVGAGATVRLAVTDADGITWSYYVLTDWAGNFSLDAPGAGEACFGANRIGDGSAQAFYEPLGPASNMVYWSVTWFVIHTTK
jgi:hypothetical protein